MAEQERQGRRGERERALQVLPEMLNKILIQTGKVFKDPAGFAQRDGTRGAPVAQVVQAAIQGFHGALDALEIQLLQAKAALSQDLADFRAKEAEAQRQSDAENQTEVAIPPPSSQVGKEAIPPTAETEPPKPERKDDTKVTITIDDDEPVEITKEVTGQPTNPKQEAIRFSPVMSSPPAPPPEVIDTTGPPKSTDAGVPQEGHQAIDSTTAQAPAQEEISTTTGLNEMDFDSMFPDITGDGGGPDLDLDLNFSAHSNLDHDTLVGQGFSIEPSTTLQGPRTTTANDEMDALLPGLGSYASAVDDIGAIEVPMTTTANATTTSPHKANVDPSGTAMSTNLESTNLDDLFAESADFNLDDDGNNSTFDVGAGGEFNDAFFGLEGS